MKNTTNKAEIQTEHETYQTDKSRFQFMRAQSSTHTPTHKRIIIIKETAD